jgi:hypothetical protein
MFLLCFSYDNLAEAEQFALSLANIKRLVPRLKSLRCVHFPFATNRPMMLYYTCPL